jgi:hypothetical protein
MRTTITSRATSATLPNKFDIAARLRDIFDLPAGLVISKTSKSPFQYLLDG